MYIERYILARSFNCRCHGNATIRFLLLLLAYMWL